MNDYVMQTQEERQAQKAGQTKEPKALTGRTVLFSLVAFFVVVSTVNAIMMTLAIKTMPGADVKSAYEASQTYNAEIARAQAQETRGWSADVTLGKGEGRDVTIRLTDRSGAPVQGLSLKTRLAHPADRNSDIVAEAKEIAPGVYAANIAAAHGGAWDLVLEGREANREVYKSRSRIRL